MMPQLVTVMLLLTAQPAKSSNGFSHAIKSVQAVTVKLYGLSAGSQQGYGSGILVSSDGLVLTVDSILIDGSNTRAVTPDGALYAVDIIARNREEQLALLQLRDASDPQAKPEGIICLNVGSSDELSSGDWVIAAGNPFKVADGAEPASVALGIFGGRSNLDAQRRKQDYPYRGPVLVIDAVTSNPGAPGGPLADLEGELVGMVGRVVVSNTTHTQFNHAIPIEICSAFIARATQQSTDGLDQADLNDARAIVPAELGIKLFQMGYKKSLVFVDRVKRGSVAFKAGLRADDLIVSLDGRGVADIRTFEKVLSRLDRAKDIELIVIRKEEHIPLTIKPEPAQ